MLKGMVTAVLSESLVQVIIGFGFPSAEQFKVNLAGAVTIWLLEMTILLGDLETTKKLKKPSCCLNLCNYKYIFEPILYTVLSVNSLIRNKFSFNIKLSCRISQSSVFHLSPVQSKKKKKVILLKW